MFVVCVQPETAKIQDRFAPLFLRFSIVLFEWLAFFTVYPVAVERFAPFYQIVLSLSMSSFSDSLVLAPFERSAPFSWILYSLSSGSLLFLRFSTF